MDINCYTAANSSFKMLQSPTKYEENIQPVPKDCLTLFFPYSTLTHGICIHTNY